MGSKIRLGMVGGGIGAFIGAVHRNAAWLDGLYELVCGAFSADSGKSRRSGAELGLDPVRVYGDFREMIVREGSLSPDKRMQVVAIVTPNHLHFEPAKMALEAGYDVILDKPMTFSLAEARTLEALVKSTGRRLLLTHTYIGYPMVKEARRIVLGGELGRIRKVYVEYPQGWLTKPIEAEGQKQASWRTDPAQSGAGGCVGDIGIHAFNLAEYVTGMNVVSICPDLLTMVEGRKLDDDVNVLMRFDNGGSGVLTASQICAGEENDIMIRVYGELGGLEWRQTDLNSLKLKWIDKPIEIRRTATGYTSSYCRMNTRTPSGHPEGFIEAFANLYRCFAQCLEADAKGEKPADEWLDYPGAHEGVRGMAFIETCVSGSASNKKWIEFNP